MNIIICNDSDGHTWAVELNDANVDACIRHLLQAGVELNQGSVHSPPLAQAGLWTDVRKILADMTLEQKASVLPVGRNRGGILAVCNPSGQRWYDRNPFR